MDEDTPLPGPDELISFKQLSAILGVEQSRLDRRAKKGLLDATLVDGKFYITTLRRVVNSYGRSKKGPAPTPIPQQVLDLVRSG